MQSRSLLSYTVKGCTKSLKKQEVFIFWSRVFLVADETLATTNRLFQLIPKISWLYAVGSMLFPFHINLLWEVEDLLKVGKKSTSAERLDLELGQSCFSTHITHPAHSTSLLCSQVLLRQEGKIPGAILYFTYCRMDTTGVCGTKTSKTPELVIQLKLSISSWEPGTDTSKGSKNLENSACPKGRQVATPVLPFAWIHSLILNIPQWEG